ncbi:16S rRNA processing protein RimM [Hydrogenoanaerobacterium saccharovorans]|uniref:Ribosome maturation factor RimM n=1 Tax=Hydrogenoanaerobacterium saccharovorans TaxID=474960 RepID=A0ABS2GKQ3_9FIRM|nr:ribosome maturation factor RimM [Hydrogenoanaerobacterium saccharovorans]MBM6923052.1 16S rRNA processing protein RimM [Hydrogenoanaerobacterium saccharovorans]HIY80780.1 ribosome maturation factor RimM [Bacillota bacterium]
MPKEYLECGKIVTTHGVRGEVKVQPWCDGPEFLGQFGTLYLDAAGTRPVKVLSAKVAGNMSVLKLEGLDTPEEARNWRGRVLYLRRADVKLAPGDYFIQDLIGLRVIDAADPSVEYGVVEDVSSTGANDVYHIAREGRSTVLIPAIKQVIAGVDLEEGVMHITPLEGLFDED